MKTVAERRASPPMVGCQRWGVSANYRGSVSRLDLSDNQLSGEIPPELGYLANLWLLNLGSNQLSGELPPGLGYLANLQELNLSDNQLSGCIPSGLKGRVSSSELGGLPFCARPAIVP